MLDQIHQSPSECGGKIGHRGDMYQRHVERDTTDSIVVRFISPRVNDPVEQALALVAAAHRIAYDVDDLVERGSLGLLARSGDRRHRVRMHEGIGAIESVEGTHQPFKWLSV